MIMALPKLNTVTYDLKLPSTGQKLEYRPFLVKEQKTLMIAQDDKNNKRRFHPPMCFRSYSYN